jgi:hypothetical protein
MTPSKPDFVHHYPHGLDLHPEWKVYNVRIRVMNVEIERIVSSSFRMVDSALSLDSVKRGQTISQCVYDVYTCSWAEQERERG